MAASTSTALATPLSPTQLILQRQNLASIKSNSAFLERLRLEPEFEKAHSRSNAAWLFYLAAKDQLSLFHYDNAMGWLACAIILNIGHHELDAKCDEVKSMLQTIQLRYITSISAIKEHCKNIITNFAIISDEQKTVNLFPPPEYKKIIYALAEHDPEQKYLEEIRLLENQLLETKPVSATEEKKPSSSLKEQYIDRICKVHTILPVHHSLSNVLQAQPQLALEPKLTPVIQALAERELNPADSKEVSDAFSAVALYQLRKHEAMPEALLCIYYYLYYNLYKSRQTALDQWHTIDRLFYLEQPSELSRKKIDSEQEIFVNIIRKASSKTDYLAALALCEAKIASENTTILFRLYASDICKKIAVYDPSYLAHAIRFHHDAIWFKNNDRPNFRLGQFTILMCEKLLNLAREAKREDDIILAKQLLADAYHYVDPKIKVKLLRECYEHSKESKSEAKEALASCSFLESYVKALVHANDNALFEAAEDEPHYRIQIYLAKRDISQPESKSFERSIARFTKAIAFLEKETPEIQFILCKEILTFLQSVAIPECDKERKKAINELKKQLTEKLTPIQAFIAEAEAKTKIETQERESKQKKEKEEKDKITLEYKTVAAIDYAVKKVLRKEAFSTEDCKNIIEPHRSHPTCATLFAYNHAETSSRLSEEGKRYLQQQVKKSDPLATLLLARLMVKANSIHWAIILYGLVYMDIRLNKTENMQTMRREAQLFIEHYALREKPLACPTKPEESRLSFFKNKKKYQDELEEYAKQTHLYNFPINKLAQWMRLQHTTGRFPIDVKTEEQKLAHEAKHPDEARAPLRQLKEQVVALNNEEAIKTITPIQVILYFLSQDWTPVSLRKEYVNFALDYRGMRCFFETYLQNICLLSIQDDESKAEWAHLMNTTPLITCFSSLPKTGGASSLSTTGATEVERPRSHSSSSSSSAGEGIPLRPLPHFFPPAGVGTGAASSAAVCSRT